MRWWFLNTASNSVDVPVHPGRRPGGAGRRKNTMTTDVSTSFRLLRRRPPGISTTSTGWSRDRAGYDERPADGQRLAGRTAGQRRRPPRHLHRCAFRFGPRGRAGGERRPPDAGAGRHRCGGLRPVRRCGRERHGGGKAPVPRPREQPEAPAGIRRGSTSSRSSWPWWSSAWDGPQPRSSTGWCWRGRRGAGRLALVRLANRLELRCTIPVVPQHPQRSAGALPGGLARHVD
jgi:hypothetical protein